MQNSPNEANQLDQDHNIERLQSHAYGISGSHATDTDTDTEIDTGTIPQNIRILAIDTFS